MLLIDLYNCLKGMYTRVRVLCEGNIFTCVWQPYLPRLQIWTAAQH